MTGTVTSSSAPNCGGPMQQYYNPGCGENGQQQSYMHMTQSQGMTFSQQRARLLSAGASPTNIRPPNGVQQQQPNINSEHHMLPQHMNRTPVSTFDFQIDDSSKIINMFVQNQMNMMVPNGCRPPPPEYKLNVAQNMGMCQTQFAAQGYIPPARQSMPQGAQSRRNIQQQPIPPSGIYT